MKLENIAGEEDLKKIFEQEGNDQPDMAQAAQAMRDRAERRRDIRKQIQYFRNQIRDLRQELNSL